VIAPSGNNPASTPATAYKPKPYDPSKPIDLGGYPGVTPAERARAEKLVRDTLLYLPHYADTATAYREGYRSIGDAGTGDEHYVKFSYADDGHILDPKYPESLVYEVINGKKTLVAAMYILPFGTRYTDIPDVGGPMTQWHVHDDLCLAPTSDPLQKQVTLARPDGTCAPGQVTAGKAPMIHVWIVPNKCGPFAALEGIGAGQTTDGNGRLCDRVHGSP